MPKKEEEQKFDYFLFSGIIIVLIVVLAILSVYSFLQQEPEYFSQVYFEPEKLLSEVEKGKEFPVIFFIDNREGKDVAYTYKITAEGETKKEAEITVANGEVKKVAELIYFDERHEEKQKVLVEVVKPEKEKPYSLWFWVDVN
ncbi:DUF1616 domain-containing protein [Candidatus Micrarchaeota archaeon]|nr:DUF1616 domain-containing protein [Candidatus Micrarchaeota archaeon]